MWYTATMKYDYTTFYNKNAEFFLSHPKAKRALLVFNTLATYIFILAYALLFVYGLKKGNFTPNDFTNVFFAPAMALFVVTVLRLAIQHPRPYDEDGANIIPLKKKEGDSSSFPSRHLTCATVISTVFLPYIPAVGVLLFVFSLLLGYARFAIGWHYPSDLFAGFFLGVAMGIIPMLI